jgi:hypothetical protein
MIDITHEQQYPSIGYGDIKDRYEKTTVEEEGRIKERGMSSEEDILYCTMTSRKSRRMLPFAFQVTDAHKQDNYH